MGARQGGYLDTFLQAAGTSVPRVGATTKVRLTQYR